jgi:hypothetical protein
MVEYPTSTYTKKDDHRDSKWFVYILNGRKKPFNGNLGSKFAFSFPFQD